MKKIFLVVILIMTILIVIYQKPSEQTEDYTGNYYSGNNIECLYYNPADFVTAKQFEPYRQGAVIRGSILPHHLLASDMIHEVFQNVKNQQYKTVVLIGPDHESILMGKVFTSLKDWQTPMGVLKTNREIVSRLLQNDFMIEDDAKMTKEHSVSSIVPFVKYYLSDAEIVGMAMSKQTKLKDIEKLIEDLGNLVDIEKTLFIASVDFSHYLTLEEADRMDAITMDAIKNKDINKIMSFTNDNLDSPVSIVTMLGLMDKLYEADAHVLNHSNSELIVRQRMDETTSYITYIFTDKD
ncbi:AmmeMemoRadiSam system protein B [Sedimentibacter sp.]|uniref:AmmeMemoRadiSam system protein B n=1 Tax=Sedimentibacter sp. TaxID=1960295 RepID=UPI0028A07205|nr:AmmeMemoRadiSam system protein B [Sedimentibacter sp.]